MSGAYLVPESVVSSWRCRGQSIAVARTVVETCCRCCSISVGGTLRQLESILPAGGDIFNGTESFMPSMIYRSCRR